MKRTWSLFVMLVGGLCFMNYSLGVLQAQAAPPDKGDPFTGVTESWDKNIPSASRFTVLSAFGGAAVRDNNTGLVWVQAPDTSDHSWDSARRFCLNKNIQGTVGWRLPSVVELKSIQNPTLLAPFVPPSVFSNVQPAAYWSATSNATNPSNAWLVDFGSFGAVIDIAKFDVFLAWCVRGPMQEGVY